MSRRWAVSVGEFQGRYGGRHSGLPSAAHRPCQGRSRRALGPLPGPPGVAVDQHRARRPPRRRSAGPRGWPRRRRPRRPTRSATAGGVDAELGRDQIDHVVRVPPGRRQNVQGIDVGQAARTDSGVVQGGRRRPPRSCRAACDGDVGSGSRLTYWATPTSTGVRSSIMPIGWHHRRLLDRRGCSMDVDDMTLISVDDHVLEPIDVFVDRVPRRYADDAPRVVTDDDGRQRWVVSGQAPRLRR